MGGLNTWKDLLLLLEGETLKLPALKNLSAEDVIICIDVAIFATSKAPIVYQGPYNSSVTKKKNKHTNGFQHLIIFDKYMYTSHHQN